MTKTIEQKGLKFIDENHLIEKGDKVLVALSGGADSVFLLYFLLKFKKRFGINLAAFHLNHRLRGKSANDDEKFCVRICSDHNIELVHTSKDLKSLSKKMKVSVEEAAREIRYSELRKAAKKLKCSKIATAHNANDNVETILLNLFKGTGIKGLTGIPITRQNIIRPILCLSSEEIRQYLKKNNIPFRVDESNLQSEYERNFLRNEIIPKLKSRLNPQLEEKINNTARIISEVNSFVEKQSEKFVKKSIKIKTNEIDIDINALKKLDESLFSIILKTVIENNFEIELSSENIYSTMELLNLQTGRIVQLKQNVFVSKERNKLVIRKRDIRKKDKPVQNIRVGQNVKIEGRTISITEVNRKMIKFTSDKSVEFIFADDLKKNFEIRKWKAGDKFQPIGMKGTKKISDYLADEKIPSSEKKDKLVLTNNGKIVWVIGLRIDERFKVKKETKKILQLSLTEK